jgi:hypothetical protein
MQRSLRRTIIPRLKRLKLLAVMATAIKKFNEFTFELT